MRSLSNKTYVLRGNRKFNGKYKNINTYISNINILINCIKWGSNPRSLRELGLKSNALTTRPLMLRKLLH